MDSVFDRWGEGIVYVGIVAGCLAADFDQGAFLAAAALTSAFMVSYARAKSEGLGFSEGTGMAAVGLAPREVRIVILTIGLLWDGLAGDPTPLAASLALITILATITTLQRITFVIRQNTERENT
jgi:CDP-diacylglycerol--glycerol-3-phosphate 3-phosphatidyltransferase